MSNDKDLDPIERYFEMKEGRIKLAQKVELESDSPKIMNAYLSMLRIIYIVAQHGHWKCKGSNFYGNHLLLQRIYEDASDLVDAAAEKLIGVFGNDALNHVEQIERIAGVFKKYSSDDHIDNVKNAANDFLVASEDAYNRIKEIGDMTLGLDDMIMAQASKVEEFVFLLNQASEL